MANTRFNPTPNGHLHLGHIYMILLNYHTAKKTNGKFIVRFEDSNLLEMEDFEKKKMNQYCKEIKEDLAWFGIKPDLYTYGSKERDRNEKYLKKFKILNLVKTHRMWNSQKILPKVKNTRTYPYTPHLTALKVVQDWKEECNLLIRGDDLVSEFSLYCHFCKLLNIPIPKFYYVPRLMQGNKNKISELCNVEKTQGNFKLRDYKEKGYTPEQIKKMLEKACLIDKTKGWDYKNIKKNPVIYT